MITITSRHAKHCKFKAQSHRVHSTSLYFTARIVHATNYLFRAHKHTRFICFNLEIFSRPQIHFDPRSTNFLSTKNIQTHNTFLIEYKIITNTDTIFQSVKTIEQFSNLRNNVLKLVCVAKKSNFEFDRSRTKRDEKLLLKNPKTMFDLIFSNRKYGVKSWNKLVVKIASPFGITLIEKIKNEHPTHDIIIWQTRRNLQSHLHHTEHEIFKNAILKLKNFKKLNLKHQWFIIRQKTMHTHCCSMDSHDTFTN